MIGSFCTFLPIPFQTIPCLFLVMWIRANVPIAIAIVWISNPFTMAPMMYFNYRFGTFMLNRPNTVTEIHVSVNWLSEQFALIWQPLLLGSLVIGTTFGLIGFMLVRVYWRWKVAKDWSMRKLRKKIKRK